MAKRDSTYYRSYRAGKKQERNDLSAKHESELKQAYRRGAEDMQDILAGKFRNVGIGELNGYTAVSIVKMELPPQWTRREDR